jgi:glutamyl-tRNA synthetase
MKVMEICREKVNTLVQLLEMVKPFLIDEYEYSEEYIKSFISETRSLEILKKALDDFKDKEFKNIEDIRTLLENVAKELEIKKRVVFQIIRGALLGKLITPGLFESIKVLGKNRTIQRLKRTIEIGGSWLKNVSP